MKAMATLEKLSDFAKTHFRVEACLMRLIDNPELKTHKPERRQFVAQFRLQSLSQDVSRLVTAYLMQWLLNHINYADRKYVRHFRRERGLPVTAQMPMETGSA
jgi:hemerythrin-like metal-binding protein